jgi:hypothetical protein
VVISRTNVRSISCPACDAPAGDRCRGSGDSLRTSCHAERWEVYRATLPVLLHANLRPVIFKHPYGWACTSTRDWRRCRTTYVSGSPMGAYLKWFMARSTAAKRQIVVAQPRVAQYLDEGMRRYLEMPR